MSFHDDPLIQAIRRGIQEKIADLGAGVAKGQCASFDDYKRRTGMINGLDMAALIIDEIVKGYGEEEGD